MSSNLLVALILLPVMGALIAWAGDVIGYRLGKTRRTIFGLRPRTTARLVGAVVGGVLPLGGLLFAMAVSQDARDAILRIGELRRQAASLSDDNRTLLAEKGRALGDARSAELRAGEAREEWLNAEERLQATQVKLAASEEALEAMQAELQATTAELSAAQAELSAAQAELSTAQAELSTAQAELSTAQAELSTAQAELTETRDRLASEQKELASEQAQFKQVEKYARIIAEAKAYHEGLVNQLAAAQEELEDTQLWLARYLIERQAIIKEPVAYEPGAELIRRTVEAGRPQEEIEGVLNTLLELAGFAAHRDHGVQIGANERAVRVVSPMPSEMLFSRVSEGDIVREVAKQIREGDAPTYVVVVRAWGRTFQKQAQPMLVEFWAAPNEIVFRAGDIILSTVIDGGRPRAHVFRTLWQRVGGIRQVAAGRGMLPSPATGQYGGVPAEDLLGALDEVLAIGGPATVSFVVTNDARVAQPEDAPMRVRVDVGEAGFR